MSKVIELNLETGSPSVTEAMGRLKNTLPTYKRQGYKAVIIIHGYGSSGVGGAIKTATRKLLGETSMSGVVRMVIHGEQWSYRKKEAIGLCSDLSLWDRRMAGNAGLSVVILK